MRKFPNLADVDPELDYVVRGSLLGDKGMAEMAEMQMPLPPNTLPMMSGSGPYGPIAMGGMFTTITVRKSLAKGDYRDPGWYRQPPGSSAC